MTGDRMSWQQLLDDTRIRDALECRDSVSIRPFLEAFAPSRSVPARWPSQGDAFLEAGSPYQTTDD